MVSKYAVFRPSEYILEFIMIFLYTHCDLYCLCVYKYRESLSAHPFWAPNNPAVPSPMPAQPAFELYCR